MRTFMRVVGAAALLAALTLALPARAEAASPGGSEGLWGWLTGLLESRLQLLLGGHVASEKPPANKEGSGVDSSGGTNGAATCPGGPSCGDAGSGQDPNG
jgi:hypothetical protein